MNIKVIEKKEIEFAISKTLSMRAASEFINKPFSTFKRYAKLYGLYKTNQGSVGIIRKTSTPLEDIFSGKCTYPTHALKIRLIKENIFEYKCYECGLTEWNNKKISLELHHKDGNKRNHSLKNLILLCPNCHSQTDNYRKKKLKT